MVCRQTQFFPHILNMIEIITVLFYIHFTSIKFIRNLNRYKMILLNVQKKNSKKLCLASVSTSSKHKNIEPTEWFIHLDHPKQNTRHKVAPDARASTRGTMDIILPLIEILKFDWLRQIIYAAILCFLTNLIFLIYPLHVTY